MADVSAVAPPLGSAILRMQHVQFDLNVVDLEPIQITALFADGTTDVVWDGEGFSSLYAIDSSQAPGGPGTHFVVLRRGGWKSALLKVMVD